ncbi:hypothetical protein GN956_G19484 [Arapaima gigas]
MFRTDRRRDQILIQGQTFPDQRQTDALCRLGGLLQVFAAQRSRHLPEGVLDTWEVYEPEREDSNPAPAIIFQL